MKKQKTSFIKAHFNRPVKLLKQSLSFIPQTLPFLKNQKILLDEWSEIAREKIKNPAKSNLELGEKFFIEQKYGDAKFRFKLALLFNKEYGLAYFLLAKTYLAQGVINKAVDNLAKAKKYKINHEEFDYFYQIYLQDNFNILANSQQSKEFFNHLATLMDDFYLKHFSYQAIDKVFDLFITHQQPNHHKILDLGCGNGLLGKKIKEALPQSEITGLDFATEMINISKNLYLSENQSEAAEVKIINVKNKETEAIKQPIYDFLIRSNFNKFTDISKIYDIIISRGFLNYQNNHAEIIAKIAQLTAQKGYFIGYINNIMTENALLEKRDNFSIPFFHNYNQIEFTKLNDIFIKNSFQLITKQEFALEKDNLATIFIYQKK